MNINITILEMIFDSIKQKRFNYDLNEKNQIFFSIKEKHKTFEWAEFVEYITLIEDLKKSSYEICSNIRDNKLPEKKAMEQIKTLYPNLSKKIYNDILSNGFYESMW